jgi:hypothetical protein
MYKYLFSKNFSRKIFLPKFNFSHKFKKILIISRGGENKNKISTSISYNTNLEDENYNKIILTKLIQKEKLSQDDIVYRELSQWIEYLPKLTFNSKTKIMAASYCMFLLYRIKREFPKFKLQKIIDNLLTGLKEIYQNNTNDKFSTLELLNLYVRITVSSSGFFPFSEIKNKFSPSELESYSATQLMKVF